MIPKNFPIAFMKYLILCFLLLQQAVGQGLDNPLTIQGIDHTTLSSAASRAAGGITIGVENDVGLMFSNPASLQSLEYPQLALGGSQQYLRTDQIQQYAPLKYYSNFSLLMEGLTGYIPNPDTAGSNAGDTVQRPFDNIGPNWYRAKNSSQPIQALIGIPVSVGETKFTIGLGAVKYADLNHFYQNNNVLSPDPGSERNLPPVYRPVNDSSPVSTDWYQYIRSRDGSIWGYGAAIAGAVSDDISLGVSGMVLNGSSDDYELHNGRGTLVFYMNYFRLDTLNETIVRTGSSDYSGEEFTLSGIYRGTHVSIGFAVKPPSTITRKFSLRQTTDSAGIRVSAGINGQDKIRLPWRGTVGLSIGIARNTTLGLEYELRSYESAVYTNPSGTESNPWLTASVVHVGAAYEATDWLALRAGMRGQSEVFQPEGNPIIGDPVSYTIYSAGCGISWSGIHLNLTYEYGLMKYDDTWQTNVNLNTERRHTIVADIIYQLPSL